MVGIRPGLCEFAPGSPDVARLPACYLDDALFLASSLGVLGFQVSRHGYAWLLGAATTDMVLLAALADPRSALSVNMWQLRT